MNLRIVIGLAVSVSTAVQAGVIALLSSTGGAFAARQPFMRAALVLWAVGWVSSVLVVQRLGGGQFTFADAASANAMAIVLSGIATVLGVRAGRRLDRHVRGPAADATP
jgi:hypothetical protein